MSYNCLFPNLYVCGWTASILCRVPGTCFSWCSFYFFGAFLQFKKFFSFIIRHPPGQPLESSLALCNFKLSILSGHHWSVTETADRARLRRNVGVAHAVYLSLLSSTFANHSHFPNLFLSYSRIVSRLPLEHIPLPCYDSGTEGRRWKLPVSRC